MKNIDQLNTIVEKKLGRESELEATNKQLEELDEILFGSRFSRWFGTTYLVLKGFITLLLGFGILFIGLIFIFAPGLILGDEQLKSELISAFRAEYAEIVGSTVKESVELMIEKRTEMTIDEFMNQMDNAADIVIEEQVIEVFLFYGAVLIVLSFVLFYISRLTQKMKVRNSKISTAEALTQDLIVHYRKLIQYNSDELHQLQDFRNELNK